MHEAQVHDRNTFITLTYSDESIPSDRSVDVREWQLFAKALRKKISPFRFFHCGEYGDRLHRPHYHACLFGLDFNDDRIFLKTSKAGDALFTSPTLDSVWKKGHAVIGEVTFDSAAYVARYIMKKVNGNQAENHYAWTDETTGEVHLRRPEYTTMSRRPGIGKEWFDRYGGEVFRGDFVVTNGRKAQPPKYYDRLFEMEAPEEMERIKRARAMQAGKNVWNQTRERLLVREKVRKAQGNLYNRELD